jgi:hypothetical protein
LGNFYSNIRFPYNCGEVLKSWDLLNETGNVRGFKHQRVATSRASPVDRCSKPWIFVEKLIESMY